jgi:hypothetical protein
MPAQTSSSPTKLKVFCSYVTPDLIKVREIYDSLIEMGLDAWIDRESILPGENWKHTITKASHRSDVILIFISKNSISREGYYQKEFSLALDIALQKPIETIYIIPVKLEECELPDQIKDRDIQWLDWYYDGSLGRLIRSLRTRAEELGISIGFNDEKSDLYITSDIASRQAELTILDLMACKRASKNIQHLYSRVGLDTYYQPGADTGVLHQILLDTCKTESLVTDLVSAIYPYEIIKRE